jgi:hypothetical protein
MLRVKMCRCVICWHRLGVVNSPCHAHHIGTGVERHDFATIPLCHEHHVGATGVHGMHRRAFELLWKVTPLLLLAWAVAEVFRDA